MGVINISDVKTMRSRLARQLLAFVVAFTVAIPLFRFFSWDGKSEQTKIGSAANKKPRRSLIEKSVLLRYGDTDPLTIFSAYSHSDRTTVIIAAYGYMMQSSDTYSDIVLNDYENEGILEIVNISESTNCLKRHRCRHEIQLQDCVFRTRGRSDWVATVDLDERISVNGGSTVRQYIESHALPVNAELRFRCRWLLRLEEIPADPIQWRVEDSRIPMDVWHNTSHVAPVNHTTKSIIQPLKVESMGVHQVLRFSPGTTVRLVPPEHAVVRHYRLTKGWAYFLKEAETFGSFEDTYVAPELLEAIQLAVNNKVNKLFPESKPKVLK
nr:Protein of unknown function DUF23 domain containing protein [Haemonchus contortus]